MRRAGKRARPRRPPRWRPWRAAAEPWPGRAERSGLASAPRAGRAACAHGAGGRPRRPPLSRSMRMVTFGASSVHRCQLQIQPPKLPPPRVLTSAERRADVLLIARWTRVLWEQQPTHTLHSLTLMERSLCMPAMGAPSQTAMCSITTQSDRRRRSPFVQDARPRARARGLLSTSSVARVLLGSLGARLPTSRTLWRQSCVLSRCVQGSTSTPTRASMATTQTPCSPCWTDPTLCAHRHAVGAALLDPATFSIGTWIRRLSSFRSTVAA